MTNSLVATLPGGYWVNGACRRDAELRELTGEDQIFLMEDAASLPLAQWATEVLTRCLTRLGPGEPVTREAVRALTVGDREALLLHLRRLTVGDRLQCVLTCPSPACGHKLDFEVRVSELLLLPGGEAAKRHELAIRPPDVDYIVRFRLPTGADQEAVALLGRTDPDAAAALLLQRCVESIDSTDGVELQEFPAALIDPLSARMAELDAQAELTLNITCSVCGATFTTVFDAASYLFQELLAGMRNLDREVHLLAYHYHWSPSEILTMSPRRRRRYLQLLEEELAQGAGG
jgi:hypothetical protein